jgi:dolichol-phosphate mannosyltransferase
VKITVIVPMYNEESNVEALVKALNEGLAAVPDWEFLPANDGSADGTLAKLKAAAAKQNNIRIISYERNRGQGYAMRQAFAAASGDVIVTLDSDLSYAPVDIKKLLRVLEENDQIDIASGCPYCKEAGTEGVPTLRLILSRGANRLLGWALPGHLKTVTGMFRAYRKELLDSLDLESDGKEIHFEILSKALAVGAKVEEIPSVLRGRMGGRSSIRVWAAIVSHLLFSFFERPAILFETIGLGLFTLGLASGGYIIWLWRHAELDPTRPLMILMALLIIVGSLVVALGFIASQISQLRREIYRVQKENLEIKRELTKNRTPRG